MSEHDSPEQAAVRERAIAGVRKVTRLFLIVGVLILCVCAYLVIEKARFLANAHETSATVLRVDQMSTSSGHRGGSTMMYQPTFEYTHAEGDVYTATTKNWSSAWGYREGDVVRIRYDPDEPSDVRPKTGFFTEWMAQLITGGIGIVCIAMMLLVRYSLSKHADSLRLE